MKKYVGMICILLLSLTAQCQEIKFSGSLVGFGIAKIENGKKLVLVSFFDVGYEKMIDYFWRWRVGVGYSAIQYNGTNKNGMEYFRQKKYITMPLAIRKYYSISKRSEVYWEVGVFNKYELIDKIDYNDDPLQSDMKYSKGGYSLDGFGFAGFKTQMGGGYTIDIGSGGTKNLFAKYKMKENEIRVTASYLTVSFAKKLGK